MVRTLRDGWCWALAALLCAGTLSACRHAGGEWALPTRVDPPVPVAPDPGAAPAERQTGWDDRAASPYHRVDPPAAPAGAPADVQVRRAVYPPDEPAAAPARPPDKAAQVASLAGDPPAGPQVIQFDTGGKPAPEPPLVAALRCFLDNQPAKAVAILQKYDKPNQEMLLGLLPLTVALSRGSLERASPQEVSHYVAQLQSLLRPLLTRTELGIDKMVYCEWIRDFGVYKPLRPGHTFYPPLGAQPGEPVQVYVELSNVSCVPHGEVFESRLASVVMVRPAGGGKPIWQRDCKDSIPPFLSRTVRRERFLNCSFYVPVIPPGRYELTIEIRDLCSGRRAERTLPFCVGLSNHSL
jgi:hypothetical protein